MASFDYQKKKSSTLLSLVFLRYQSQFYLSESLSFESSSVDDELGLENVNCGTRSIFRFDIGRGIFVLAFDDRLLFNDDGEYSLAVVVVVVGVVITDEGVDTLTGIFDIFCRRWIVGVEDGDGEHSTF